MKHLKYLYEYRHQLEIPFVGKDPLHDKPVHRHIIDVLEELDTKSDPDSYWSSADIDDLWDKNEEEAKEVYIENTNDIPIGAVNIFLNKYPISDNPELYSDDAKENYEDFETLMYDIESSPSDYLTSEGEEKLDEALGDYFEEALYEDVNAKHNIENNQDDDGLIPIYRAVSYYKSEFGDEFETAIKHGGVGLFWSWKESGAYPFGGGHGDTYVLHGKVKPENVNWVRTIFKSAWELRNEMEIEINKGAEILIYGIGRWDGSGFTNINPIVVPA